MNCHTRFAFVRTLLSLGLTLALLLLPGCDDSSSKNQALAPEAEQTPAGPRLVCLAPAITQMLVDMGQAHSLVGVARNDMAAPSGLPVVGDVFDINIEALLATKPTHVLLMTTKEGVSERLQSLAQGHNFKLLAYNSPRSIDDVGLLLLDEREFIPGLKNEPGGNDRRPGATLAGVTTPSLGTALDIRSRAQALKLDMMVKLGRIEQATSADKARPRVLLVIGSEPLMASGPGTTHHRLLSFLNAVNAAEDATVEAPTFDREKILTIKPDVVLYLLPNAPALGSVETDPRLAMFKGLDIPAVKNRRIHLVSDPLVLLPSSSLPRVAAVMAKLIHPAQATQIDAALKQELPAGTQPEAPAIPRLDAGKPTSSGQR